MSSKSISSKQNQLGSIPEDEPLRVVVGGKQKTPNIPVPVSSDAASLEGRVVVGGRQLSEFPPPKK